MHEHEPGNLIMEIKHPIILVILDGFGWRDNPHGNAIYHAKKPFIDFLFAHYPHTLLKASGPAVGLLPGTMGNSEVGHFIMGAGRVIPQAGTRIHNAIDDESFFSNPTLNQALEKIKQSNGRLHLMGLLSEAGVHSHEKHLFAFMKAARDMGVNEIIIHPFLDGRDSPAQSASIYLNKLEQQLDDTSFIGSIHGRFYAMDRDNNWERTEQSYNVLTEELPLQFRSWREALDYYYAHNTTDEFIPPTQLNHDGIVRNGDGIIFFNFRPDRARQLTSTFIDQTFNHFVVKPLHLSCFVTPTDYGLQLPVAIMYERPPTHNTLKEILSSAGKTIFSIAETEKYAHVTYFFSGGREEAWPHEKRVLIQSIHAKNYIAHPEMSAQQITDAVIESIEHDPKDFYLINYANADMVGHSGDFGATVKAIGCLDRELKRVYDIVITKHNGTLYVTADHGNAEEKIDETTGIAITSHTTNPVPFIMVQQQLLNKTYSFNMETIADIASFILHQSHLPIPPEMTLQNRRQ